VLGLCREGNAGRVPAVAPAGPLHPVTVPGPAVSAAVAVPVPERRDAWYPEAQAQDVAEPFVLHVSVHHEHGLDDHSRVWARRREDVGSEEFVVLMFAAPHPPQRAGMQDEVRRQGPVNRSCLGYDAYTCRLPNNTKGVAKKQGVENYMEHELNDVFFAALRLKSSSMSAKCPSWRGKQRRAR
jgi:hypothetical protein